MSWLCRSPTAIALFQRFTSGCDRWISKTPSGVNPVLDTSFHGALNRQRSGLRWPLCCCGRMAYFKHVALCVWIWLEPAAKLASSSNAAANCSVLSISVEMSADTGLSAAIALAASSSRSYISLSLSIYNTLPSSRPWSGGPSCLAEDTVDILDYGLLECYFALAVASTVKHLGEREIAL